MAHVFFLQDLKENVPRPVPKMTDEIDRSQQRSQHFQKDVTRSNMFLHSVGQWEVKKNIHVDGLIFIGIKDHMFSFKSLSMVNPMKTCSYVEEVWGTEWLGLQL